ncbi:cellulose synthase [Nocardioides caldifontis]|uniref:cellulose synthase n=1 Tax=Nocardioides caldifontis TaxID=2588938 RepID=UPI0011DF91DF|nr:cellulose synthase [Nocardioides caldifontis]
MDGFDNATWQALGLTLTIAGLAVSALVWARRGPVSGLRGVAWSLLPLAAGLTGVLRLGWEVTDSVVTWAGRLVFSPVVWLGLVVAALSAVLFVVTGFAKRRQRGAGGPGGDEPAAVTSRGRPAAADAAGPKRPAEPAVDPDLADIEELLRRRGIS